MPEVLVTKATTKDDEQDDDQSGEEENKQLLGAPVPKIMTLLPVTEL